MREGYREIEVYIGPLREYETKPGEYTRGLHIVSNGNVDTLKVRVSCEKQVVSSGSTCTIQIWNLSLKTITAIRTAGASVRVYVVYEGQEKDLLYTGGIQSVTTDRQGPDFVTKIVCLAGGSSMIRSVASKSYSAGVDLKSAVMELAQQLPGITPDAVNVNLSGTIGYAGWSFCGSTKDALDKLAYQFGFSWNIDNGIFNAYMDGADNGRIILLNSANGLRKVSPRLAGFLQIQEGVDIVAMYRPNVGPNTSVRVVSEINPNLNRVYTCHTVGYDLCPKDDSWEMNISSFFTFGAWR